MTWPLVLAGLAMGVAAMPHCTAMCGAPCAALTRSGPAAGAFHFARLAGYMAAGAVTAASIASLGVWSQAAPALRPLWTLLHLAFLALGLWWVATGRQPLWMLRRTSMQLPSDGALPVAVRIRRRGPVTRASLAGLAWVAWPCAALQGGLLLAALADSAFGGALVMAAFALGSMPGLAAAPWAWARWRVWRGDGAAGTAEVASIGMRVAGLGLVTASGWALTHGLWARFAAWCAG